MDDDIVDLSEIETSDFGDEDLSAIFVRLSVIEDALRRHGIEVPTFVPTEFKQEAN